MKSMKLFALAALLLTSVASFGQVKAKDDKKFQKAIELNKEAKNLSDLNEADELCGELLDKFPASDNVWELRIKLRWRIYSYWLDNNRKIEIDEETEAKLRKSAKNKAMGDSIVKQAKEYYADKTIADLKLDNLLSSCRAATLLSPTIENAPHYLRVFLIDHRTDTAVSTEAKEHFDVAQEEYSKENYSIAGQSYKKAIAEEPNYYLATLYLGDCYYYKEDYKNAEKYYREAIKLQPTILQPRKDLVISLMKQDKLQDAYDASKEAFIVYPGNEVFVRFASIVEKMGKKFDRKWTMRGVFPNVIGGETNDNVQNSNWKMYAESKSIIEPFCDSTGTIVKSNALTKAEYAEVYAWEEMLRVAPAKDFAEAREMQEKGYLDCYVFVSLFHNDLYPQYKEFAAKNQDRIRKYIDLLVTD